MRPLAFAFLLTGAAAAPLFAGAPNQADKIEAEPRYNPASVIDVMARVVSVREVTRNEALSGIHLLLSTDTGEIDAYLGPAEFLKEFEITFSKGDDVQIVGSKVTFGGAFVVLAREVRKGEIYLYLRDRNGFPNWPPRRKPTT